MAGRVFNAHQTIVLLVVLRDPAVQVAVVVLQVVGAGLVVVTRRVLPVAAAVVPLVALLIKRLSISPNKTEYVVIQNMLKCVTTGLCIHAIVPSMLTVIYHVNLQELQFNLFTFESSIKLYYNYYY